LQKSAQGHRAPGSFRSHDAGISLEEGNNSAAQGIEALPPDGPIDQCRSQMNQAGATICGASADEPGVANGSARGRARRA
jgi:hypothetical protein